MSPNWNMGEVLGHRIRGLVPYRTDLANLIHFARLFQSQLIAVRILFIVSRLFEEKRRDIVFGFPSFHPSVPL